MNWRERLLTSVGPGLLCGITFHQWIHLLRQERFAVDGARLPRALSITLQSLKNSAFHCYEQHRYDSLVEAVSVEPPLFVLGHWRNGTTHLHQLLAQDRRFAFPNGYQTAFPHTFLTTEARDSRLLSFFVPKRRPMDNMEMALALPQEDEFALCTSCLKSPCMSWVFPRRRKHFGRYLTFRNVSPDEIAQWRAVFEWFLKKLTWKYRRPLRSQITGSHLPDTLAAGTVSGGEVRAHSPRSVCRVSIHSQNLASHVRLAGPAAARFEGPGRLGAGAISRDVRVILWVHPRSACLDVAVKFHG
jgi:hypothetical protein